MFCSARNIDHVGDLYPASSFYSVRLVSSWITVISSCSRSNHCFREKIQLLLTIVHPLCGSMHVVRPFVVLIPVLPRRSSQCSDSARILTYPPFGISQSKDLCRFLHAVFVPAEAGCHQRPPMWSMMLRALHKINKAKRLEGEAVMSAPLFFQSAGRGDLKFWEEDDGPVVCSTSGKVYRNRCRSTE